MAYVLCAQVQMRTYVLTTVSTNITADRKSYSIRNSGIVSMDIYRTSNRLVMIVETTEEFTWESKSIADQQNEKVKEWESLMWKYQQALPSASPGQKWILMDKVFSL